MHKIIVIVFGYSKSLDLTFNNFKLNLIDELKADLCLFSNLNSDYNNNQLYNLAKYNFVFNAIDNTNDFKSFFFRNIMENDLINKYDRFIITSSALFYQLPHPQLEYLNENCLWFPDCENYVGHIVLSKQNIEKFLNIYGEYLLKIEDDDCLNSEKQLNFYLEQINVLHMMKKFPCIMYSIADNKDTELSGDDYNKSIQYKNLFEEQGLTINDFYEKNIHIRKNYNILTPVNLSTIKTEIIEEYMIDFNDWNNKNAFINGKNSNSYNQVPDICKTHMKYINNKWELQWSKNMIEELLECCKNNEYNKLSPGDYPGSALQLVEAFTKYTDVSNKKCLVLGSISPWVECLLLHFNAESVTTLDYDVPDCNHKINMLSMDKYKKGMKYDVIISYSSLEHDGLGRYGDPINPNGDIDACIEAYSMLNDKGVFICGVPIGDGCIEGNYHRIYNKKRLNKLFSLFGEFIGSVNYQTLDESLNFKGRNWQNQPVFIYRK
jgi:hypothetical protein